MHTREFDTKIVAECVERKQMAFNMHCGWEVGEVYMGRETFGYYLHNSSFHLLFPLE